MKLLPYFYQIGGSNQSHFYDASVYLLDTGAGLILLDCGTPDGFEKLRDNMRVLGFEPDKVQAIFGTHGHYDHVGGAALWKNESHCALYLHEADRAAVENGDSVQTTAALLYDRAFPPTLVDEVLQDGQRFSYPHCAIELMHTPGHTPGSVCFIVETAGLSVLISGDTLWGGFSERIGSNEADWRYSLERIASRHYDLLSFGHSSPLLLAEADARIAEACAQFATYYNPWFKPLYKEFRF